MPALVLCLPEPGHAAPAPAPEAPNLPPAELCCSSYARALAHRKSARSTAAHSPATLASQTPAPCAERPWVLTNCRVLDADAGAYLPELQRVVLYGGKVVAVEAVARQGGEAAAAGGQQEQLQGQGEQEEWLAGLGLPPAAAVVDCVGAVVMPGLCDAHVHCTACTADLARLMSYPESYVTARAAAILGGMLARGFTTVRDAGGADFGLAQAVEEGTILGPRVLFTGHALSQTGGHGDFRGKGEELCACGAALRGIGRVCDGDAEVRRAARDELRRGAHCIKVMASGGVASPTDRLTNTQFSEAELRAIVEEAEAAGTYVCAHAYTPRAIERAVRCGVRSIEHGNYIDPPTAQAMAEKGVFLVPTIVTYRELTRGGAAAGMPPELVAKVGDAVEAGLKSLGVAHEAGVVMCYGSDLLGDLHPAQGGEFELRGGVLPACHVLRAATVNCARLFGMEYTLGRVAPGYAADLLILRPGAQPLADVCVLAEAGGAAVAAVIKGGLLAKAPMPAAAAAEREGGGWWALNDRLFGN